MNIYSIQDAAAKYFLPPFFARTDAEASRSFVSSLGDSFPHRADYTLVLIGVFDPDSGILVGRDPETILKGLSVPPDADPRVEAQMPLPLERGADTHLANGDLINAR